MNNLIRRQLFRTIIIIIHSLVVACTCGMMFIDLSGISRNIHPFIHTSQRGAERLEHIYARRKSVGEISNNNNNAVALEFELRAVWCSHSHSHSLQNGRPNGKRFGSTRHIYGCSDRSRTNLKCVIWASRVSSKRIISVSEIRLKYRVFGLAAIEINMLGLSGHFDFDLIFV